MSYFPLLCQSGFDLVFAVEASIVPLMTEQHAEVFDRGAKARQRARAAQTWPEGAFLKVEAAQRLADRLPDINRTFPLALDLGCHGGELARELKETLEGSGGIETLVQCDLSPTFARSAARQGPTGSTTCRARCCRPGAC